MGSELDQLEGRAGEFAEVAVGCPGTVWAACQPDLLRPG